MVAKKMKLSKVELSAMYAQDEQRFIAEWKKFLSFPSISTDPKHNADCVACAEWLAAEIVRCGGKAELLTTPTKPTVYGEFLVGPDAPTVVYYGHYDVQPTDPDALWISPPFEATLRQGRLYARGAQDNKGQTWYFIKALEALVKANALQVNVRLFIEGEEECGSEGISASLEAWREKLRGDVLLVCDTGTPVQGVPAVTMGLRGTFALTVTVRGPKVDLHSGVFGGVVRNPALELARIIASFHDQNGRIQIPGYYDQVRPIPPKDKALINDPLVTEERVAAYLGVAPVGGERGFSWSERRGVRPTLEINGIHSGYGGKGSKTIIPAEAVAKITGRVVADQDPEVCLEKVKAFIAQHAPEGIAVEISEAVVHGRALVLSTESRWAEMARAVLTEISPSGKVLSIWEGGSVPIVAEIARVAEIEPLLVGFGYDEDAMHSPNESFSLEQFRLGFLYAGLMLQRIGER